MAKLKLPDLTERTVWTNEDIESEPLVRKSIDEGFMNPKELLIGYWVEEALNLSTPEDFEDCEDYLKERDRL